MFQCTSIILRESLIMYAEVTKLRTYKINFAVLVITVFAIKYQCLFPNSDSLLIYWT